MAAGLPVVSTPKGAEGLDFQDGCHLRVASSSEAIAQAVVQLIEDPHQAMQLARAGQERVRETYSWPRLMDDCWKTIQAPGGRK